MAVSTHDGSLKRAGGAGGFSLIEMCVVLGILATLAALSAWGFQSLSRSINQRNFVADFASALSNAKLRALATQRNVVFIIDGTGKDPAYYLLDDQSFTDPATYTAALNTQANLATLAGAFQKGSPNYGLPANMNVRLVDSGIGTATPLIAGANVWGSGVNFFPFPFKGVPTTTTNGCTFCVANRGAVAFLPNGRAVFSSAAANTALGGAIVLGQYDGRSRVEANQSLRKAVLISVTGHMETITR